MSRRTNRPTENTEERSKRKRRSFVGDTSDVLTVEGKDPEYDYRWVTTRKGRIARMEAAGYDVVDDDLEVGMGTDKESGSANTITVNRTHGDKGILMRIRKEFAEEDRRERAKEIARTEERMFDDEKAEEARYGKVGYEKLDL